MNIESPGGGEIEVHLEAGSWVCVQVKNYSGNWSMCSLEFDDARKIADAISEAVVEGMAR